jgi:hypothetical protein
MRVKNDVELNQLVMAGLVPAIHVFSARAKKTWMPGTPGAKTRFALLHWHDD